MLVFSIFSCTHTLLFLWIQNFLRCHIATTCENYIKVWFSANSVIRYFSAVKYTNLLCLRKEHLVQKIYILNFLCINTCLLSIVCIYQIGVRCSCSFHPEIWGELLLPNLCLSFICVVEAIVTLKDHMGWSLCNKSL